MKTLSNQYKLIKEGKGHKDAFLKDARRQFPSLVTNAATFKEASTILKQKGIISENFIGSQMIGNPFNTKKEGYETAFAKFLQEAEAKAEEKKVTKEVEDINQKMGDYRDKKNPDNMIFGQIQMGVFYEAKLDKNKDKTLDEIKDIVFKNLEKDPIYYTKNGQFGVDVGYTDDNVALGEPKEPKGKHKSSGYGNLKEHSIPIGGGVVTAHTFSSRDYKDFFGLSEVEHRIPTPGELENSIELVKKLKDEMKNLEEDDINENIDPEVFQQLDSLIPRPIFESFLESITTAYNEMQLAEESIRDLKDDGNAYKFGPGPLLDYLVIQSQSAVGRDSDERLIKSLV